MTYMNHEVFSASFCYALEYGNSFQIYCKLQSVQSDSRVNSLLPMQGFCLEAKSRGGILIARAYMT